MKILWNSTIRDEIAKKKQLIKKRTQNKSNCNHKNED
jgi:hypothetical protein